MKKINKNIGDRQLYFDLDIQTLIFCYDCKIYYNKLSQADINFHKKYHRDCKKKDEVNIKNGVSDDDSKTKKANFNKLKVYEKFYKLKNLFFYLDSEFKINNLLEMSILDIKKSELVWIELRKFKEIYFINDESREKAPRKKMDKIKLVSFLKDKLGKYKNQYTGK